MTLAELRELAEESFKTSNHVALTKDEFYKLLDVCEAAIDLKRQGYAMNDLMVDALAALEADDA